MRRIPCAGMKGVPSSAAPSTSGRNELPVPMQLLRGVRVVVYFDRHRLAFFEAKQRPWELAVISDGRDDALWGNLNCTGFDVQTIVCRTALGQ